MKIREPINFMLGLLCIACVIVNIVNENMFALIVSIFGVMVNLTFGLVGY